jgi:hypothetical protein
VRLKLDGIGAADAEPLAAAADIEQHDVGALIEQGGQRLLRK